MELNQGRYVWKELILFAKKRYIYNTKTGFMQKYAVEELGIQRKNKSSCMDLLKIALSVFISFAGVDARLDSCEESDRSTEKIVAHPIEPRMLLLLVDA